MYYKGKLYGKSRGRYFEMEETTEDVDRLKERIKELEALVSKNESLHPVSQRSELLIDYMKWFDDNRDMYYEVSNKEMVDKYIKSINCG